MARKKKFKFEWWQLIIGVVILYFIISGGRKAALYYSFDTESECNAWRDDHLNNQDECWWCGSCKLNTAETQYIVTCDDHALNSGFEKGVGCDSDNSNILWLACEDCTCCETLDGPVIQNCCPGSTIGQAEYTEQACLDYILSIPQCGSSSTLWLACADYTCCETVDGPVIQNCCPGSTIGQAEYTEQACLDYLDNLLGLCGNNIEDPGEDCHNCPEDVTCGTNQVCDEQTPGNWGCDWINYECSFSSDCDDNNECTIDSCEVNECKNTKKTDGTICSTGTCVDGECVGSGTCVLEGEFIFRPRTEGLGLFNLWDVITNSWKTITDKTIHYGGWPKSGTSCCGDLVEKQAKEDFKISLFPIPDVDLPGAEDFGLYECKKPNLFDKLPTLLEDSTLNMIAWLFIGMFLLMMLMNMMPRN